MLAAEMSAGEMQMIAQEVRQGQRTGTVRS